MTRGKAAIAAAVIGIAMALAGAGIYHTIQTKATHPVVSDQSLAAEVDISGDKAVLVAGNNLDVTVDPEEERTRGAVR